MGFFHSGSPVETPYLFTIFPVVGSVGRSVTCNNHFTNEVRSPIISLLSIFLSVAMNYQGILSSIISTSSVDTENRLIFCLV